MGYMRFVKENWSFLLAGVLLSLSSSYGQTFFISIFASQIKDAFDLTDGGWGLAYTIATTASACAMVWAGALTDRFRIRALAVWVMILLAIACLMMTQAPGIWWLVLTVFLLRLAGQGMMSHLAMVAMARWFVATRGKALSIASLGHSLGSAILPIIFVAALTVVDWHLLWVAASVILIMTIPVIYRLLRQERTPQSMAKEDQSTGMDNRHWTRGEVLRHAVFWLMVPSVIGPGAWGTALFFQQVHLTEVKGWSHVGFVALFPILTTLTIVVTFASGWAIDRFGTARIIPAYMVPFAISFVMIGQADTLLAAGFGLAVFGIGMALQATLVSAFWAEFFGTRYIGAIKATAGAIMVLGSAIGPGVSGYLIDRGFDFPHQMIWYAAYFVIAGVCCTIAARTAQRALPRPA